MIRSGRTRQEIQKIANTPETRLSARIAAVVGVIVFAVFLCSSVDSAPTERQVSTVFGEGAYQAFASADGTVSDEGKDAAVVEDGSIWSYLESVIARFIYGER